MIAKHYRIAVAVGALIVIGWLPLLFVWPSPGDALGIGALCGTMFGQTTLASAWVPFGPGRMSWRLPLSAVWIGSMILVLTANTATRRGQDLDVPVFFAACLFGQWLIIQLLLWGLVLGYGLRLKNMDDPPQDVTRSFRQFGIGQLMIITVIVAIVLGMGRVAVVNFRYTFVDGQVVFYCFMCVAAIVMTLPLLIAGMLPRLAVPAVLVCLTLAGSATLWEAAFMNHFVVAPDLTDGEFIAINGITMAWVVAFLIAIRACGYRFAGSSLQHPNAVNS